VEWNNRKIIFLFFSEPWQARDFSCCPVITSAALEEKNSILKKLEIIGNYEIGFSHVTFQKATYLLQNEIGILHFLFRWNNFGISKVFQPPKR
jgi:hypothetical protein